MADATISVIDNSGVRALTHRAVDAAAGVPSGTASYHFRTPDTSSRGEVNDLAHRSAVFVDRQIGGERERTLARMACEIGVASDPALRAILHAGDVFRTSAVNALSQLGVRGPCPAGRRADCRREPPAVRSARRCRLPVRRNTWHARSPGSRSPLSCAAI